MEEVELTRSAPGVSIVVLKKTRERKVPLEMEKILL
jgi:hypothetical protein